jgi:two-component system phosphate regulon response regulator PhoB
VGLDDLEAMLIPATAATVLVVDDEPDILALLQCALGDSGFDLIEADDIPRARQQIAKRKPDVVVLDWMLPSDSGFTFLQQLRRKASTRTLPVIMLSAKTDDQDRVSALDAGADDYLCKPFSTRELRARIDALLRRAGRAPREQDQSLARGELVLDLAARRVWLRQQEIALTPIEFDLLELLVRHQDRAFSRQALMEKVWGHSRQRLDRTVDVHILRLRKALASAEGEAMIQTVRGLGYRFSLQPSASR